jgi:hypothetical protein
VFLARIASGGRDMVSQSVAAIGGEMLRVGQGARARRLSPGGAAPKDAARAGPPPLAILRGRG